MLHKIGDLYPTTILGKIFGGICAITGVILIAMPIGLLSSKFNEVYKLEDSKLEIISRYEKRKEKLGKSDSLFASTEFSRESSKTNIINFDQN